METIKRGSKGEAVKTLQKALGLKQDGIFGPLTEEAVKGFQRNAHITVDGIVGPKTWMILLGDDYGATQSDAGIKLKKSKRYINLIVVHCSATAEGQNISVETIRQWHIKGRGWADIGYHYVITLDGKIHEGRNVDQSGAHTSGHNANSIGVCYVGGVAKDGKTPKDTRNDAQKNSLLMLLKELKRMYPQATIHGHRDYANKACPSFDATKEYKNI